MVTWILSSITSKQQCLHVYRVVKPQYTMTSQHAVHALWWTAEGVALGGCVGRVGGLVHNEGKAVRFDGVDKGGHHVLD